MKSAINITRQVSEDESLDNIGANVSSKKQSDIRNAGRK